MTLGSGGPRLASRVQGDAFGAGGRYDTWHAYGCLIGYHIGFVSMCKSRVMIKSGRWGFWCLVSWCPPTTDEGVEVLLLLLLPLLYLLVKIDRSIDCTGGLGLPCRWREYRSSVGGAGEGRMISQHSSLEMGSRSSNGGVMMDERNLEGKGNTCTCHGRFPEDLVRVLFSTPTSRRCGLVVECSSNFRWVGS